MRRCFLLFYLTLLGFRCFAARTEEDEESDLRKKLLAGYDKTLPPFLFTERGKEAIFVILDRIQDLDEATSTLTTEAVIGMVWTDDRLTWNRTEYQVKYVGFPLSDIWTPRLWILNNVKPEEQVGETRAVVYNTIVFMGLRYLLHTSCVPNLKYFPFDTHKCDIEISAITQMGEMIELDVNSVEILKYRRVSTRYMTENTRWKYLNSSGRQENKTLLDGQNFLQKILTTKQELLVCCSKLCWLHNIKESLNKKRGQIVEIELFTLEMQRTTPLVAMAIMTPAVTSAILVLAAFWISPTCPVRMGIAVTGVFVSMSTLFTLGKVMPVTGSVTPIIVEYSATSLILILLFTIHTCLISLAIRSTSPFPFPYYVVLERIPTWILRLLGSDDMIPKETSMKHVLLYSEITDVEIPQEDNSILPQGKSTAVENSELTSSSTAQAPSGASAVNNEWLKPMILLDKICFYVYILILILYIISVIIKE